jgi:hypothetical protein
MHFENRKDLKGTCCFCHKRWYDVKYGLGVLKEGIIIDKNLHKEICNELFTQMNGCNTFFSHNLWFRVEEIKTEHGFL